MKKVADRIKEVIAGRSVKSVATEIGIPQTSLNAYMTGRHKITIELIKQISVNFDVSADWLLGLSDDRGGASGRGGDAEKAEYHKKLSDLEAENISLKGEVRGLQFALESALKGAQPAQDSVSHSRPA